MPPRHPSIAHALGFVRRRLGALGPWESASPWRRRVHVACSGGPDSVTLVGLLHLLAEREGLVLSVGHVDHGLRPESADEGRLVQALAESCGLPFASTRLQLTTGSGLAARAREARREALAEQARTHGASVVALGHTATDQAETMLLHLSRGAGLEGLAAMAELDSADPTDPATMARWRPLLDLDRVQTRELATRMELTFVDDPTNVDPRHPRVKVRHEVLPVLRALNPKVEGALARAAAHARQADDALAQWVETEWTQRRSEADRTPGIDGSGAEPSMGQAHAGPPPGPKASVTSGAWWSTEGMEGLPVAVRTRFVRRVCRAAGAPDDALAARTLASIDDALASPGPARSWDLHPHLRLCIASGRLWIEPSTDCAPRGQPLTL
ncbi:MAG: tRNA lysidine(34) synthetase TilS [Myxococcota bacterium]